MSLFVSLLALMTPPLLRARFFEYMQAMQHVFLPVLVINENEEPTDHDWLERDFFHVDVVRMGPKSNSLTLRLTNTPDNIYFPFGIPCFAMNFVTFRCQAWSAYDIDPLLVQQARECDRLHWCCGEAHGFPRFGYTNYTMIMSVDTVCNIYIQWRRQYQLFLLHGSGDFSFLVRHPLYEANIWWDIFDMALPPPPKQNEFPKLYL